ncbi:hypothetical protein [uncultured Polaribacter sp.]|uniref:hypothetical protein n=1 Tax=uncultured Polaribacter sp. TaxID=174711 RepID=UPI002618DD5D|nr:hypothetical protein [uncultured Polaribacter sp.]
MNKELSNKLKELQDEDEELINIGKNLIEKIGHTEFTFFCISVLNRTINLNRGYITLVKDNNYIAAAPLVRLNLDSLLRIFASIQSEFNAEIFAKNVRQGVKIRDMNYHKNKNQKLTDTKLVKLIKEIKGFKWVKKIYDAGSGYVHLSNQHFYSSVRIKNSEQIEGGIRKTDEFVSIDEKIAGTYYMTQSSKGIRIFIGDILENI